MPAAIHCLIIAVVLFHIHPRQHQVQYSSTLFFSLSGVWPLAHFYEAVQIFFWWLNCTLKSGSSMEMVTHWGIYPSGKHTSPNLVNHIPLSLLITSIPRSRSKSSNVPTWLCHSHGTLAISHQLSTSSLPSITKAAYCSLVSASSQNLQGLNFCSPMTGRILFFTCLGKKLVLTSSPLNHFHSTQMRWVPPCYNKSNVLYGTIWCRVICPFQVSLFTVLSKVIETEHFKRIIPVLCIKEGSVSVHVCWRDVITDSSGFCSLFIMALA